MTNMSQALLLSYISQRDTQGIRCSYLFIRFFLISFDESKQDESNLLSEVTLIIDILLF